jgi:AcrR family transcriptional regulator
MPQQSRSREKVARILATTARLLEQRPYDEIGTKLIAAEAGVSVGILYRFFPDKEAIVASLVVDWMDRFVQIFDETTTAPLPADPVDLLGRLIGGYADFFRSQPGFRQVWYGSRLLPAGSLDAEGRDNDRQLAQRLHGVLTRGYGMADTEQTRRSSYVAVVLADRMLDVAFRDNPAGDPDILTETVRVLARYLDVPSRGGDRAGAGGQAGAGGELGAGARPGKPGKPGEPGNRERSG